VLDALDQVGVDRFLAVGHSLGGGVAAAMADRAPTRVAGLVLTAPVGFGRVPAAPALGLAGVAHPASAVCPRCGRHCRRHEPGGGA
jgi:pimeloyl-ACP methyl ester carboxylesterase